MFRAGVLDALESIEQNQARQAAIEESRQRQARLAAEEARLREHQQMQMQEYARLNELRTHSGNALAEMMKQMQLQNAPMEGPQPVQVAPGQASVPMMQPGEGMAPPMNVLAPPISGLPPGMESQLIGEPPGTPPAPPAAMSPNWQPSAAATPELGAPPGILTGVEALNAMRPQERAAVLADMARNPNQQIASIKYDPRTASAAPAGIGAPPGAPGEPGLQPGMTSPLAGEPPPEEAPKSPEEVFKKALETTQLPGAARPGKLPPQWLSVPGALQAMEKAGVPADKRLGVMSMMLPIIQAQNKEEFQDFKFSMGLAAHLLKVQDEEIKRYKAETGRTVATQGKPGESERLSALANDPNTPPAVAADARARLTKLSTLTAGQIGPQAGDYAVEGGYKNMKPAAQAVVDWYATQDLAGDRTWRQGLGRLASSAQIIKAVDERVPTMAGDLGLSVADVGTNKAIRVASQSAHTQITKDLTTLKPYVDMLDQNGVILKDLAAKVALTDVALINKPLNYLRQNVTGNPDVAEMLAQVEVFKNEATRVISNPRLVGQMTDTARQEIEGIINGNMALGQIERVVDRLQNDGQRRIEMMNNQQTALQDKIKEMYPGAKPKEGEAAPKAAPIPKAATPSGIPMGSKKIGTSPDGKTVWQSPDGKKWVE